QPTQPTKLLDMPDASCYVQSQHQGITEYLFDLGDTVKKGDVLVRIFSTERTGTAPVEYKPQLNGIFAARRFPAMVNIGHTIAVIAEDCGEIGWLKSQLKKSKQMAYQKQTGKHLITATSHQPL
ncbi:succinylglutamate desuccinylase/aspartoacylase family protein, partial [Vibrio parahaemolyticus]|nr:succinylglutamate desuccinylase/aspartoacylase family protein [Vibrio parahaemolyticus]